MADKITIEVSDLSKVSDGYHTISELYDHRCLLWIVFLLIKPAGMGTPFFVKDHYEGWDLLGAGGLVSKQVSYHVPMKYRPLYEGKLEQRLNIDTEKTYDGHTAADVLERLQAYAKTL